MACLSVFTFILLLVAIWWKETGRISRFPWTGERKRIEILGGERWDRLRATRELQGATGKGSPKASWAARPMGFREGNWATRLRTDLEVLN